MSNFLYSVLAKSGRQTRTINALDVLLVTGDTPLEHTYMYILVCDRRVRKHKKHLVTIERD